MATKPPTSDTDSWFYKMIKKSRKLDMQFLERLDFAGRNFLRGSPNGGTFSPPIPTRQFRGPWSSMRHCPTASPMTKAKSFLSRKGHNYLIINTPVDVCNSFLHISNEVVDPKNVSFSKLPSSLQKQGQSGDQNLAPQLLCYRYHVVPTSSEWIRSQPQFCATAYRQLSMKPWRRKKELKFSYKPTSRTMGSAIARGTTLDSPSHAVPSFWSRRIPTSSTFLLASRIFSWESTEL